MRIPTYLTILLCVAATCLSKEAPASPAVPAPVLKGLRIHEWGVFLVGPGKTDAGGGGEPPVFIQRIKLPPAPEMAAPPTTAREPVLHVYANEPLRLRVTVDFPGGQPTLAWPPAIASWSFRTPRDRYALKRAVATPVLAWDLQVKPAQAADPLKVPDGHWIAAAREVGSDLLTLADGGSPERFLFYEGEVTLKPQVRIHDLVHPGITTGGCRFDSDGPSEAWCILGMEGRPPYVYHATALVKDASGKASEFVRGGDPKTLDIQLSQALLRAGLSEAEAQVLLTIWMPSLSKPGTRLVYILPRAEYDHLLPITFDPAPEELVRVGLVVQEIP